MTCPKIRTMAKEFARIKRDLDKTKMTDQDWKEAFYRAGLQTQQYTESNGTWAATKEVFYNMILYGPQTQAVNFLSTQLKFGYSLTGEAAATVVANTIRQLVGRVPGVKHIPENVTTITGSFREQVARNIGAAGILKPVAVTAKELAVATKLLASAQGREALARVAASIDAGRQAGGIGIHLMDEIASKQKLSAETAAGVIGTGPDAGIIKKGLGKLVRGSSAALGAVDSFNKFMIYRSAVAGLTVRNAERMVKAKLIKRGPEYKNYIEALTLDTNLSINQLEDKLEAGYYAAKDRFNGSPEANAHTTKVIASRKKHGRGSKEHNALVNERETLKEEYAQNDLEYRALKDRLVTTSKIKRDAILEAEQGTFTQSLQDDLISRSGLAMQNINKLTGISVAIIPFVKTPTNILRDIIDSTVLTTLVPAWGKPKKVNFDPSVLTEPKPKGVRRIAEGIRSNVGTLYGSNQFWADMRAGGARMDRALGRIAMGSTLMYGVYQAVQSGLITGAEPTNRNESRIKQELERWQPYSIYWKGQYYNYSRLEPLGSLIGLAADYGILQNDAMLREKLSKKDLEEMENILGLAAISFASNLTNKTYYKNASDFLVAITNRDPDRMDNLTKLAHRTMLSFIPNTISQISRVNDPAVRDARTLWEALAVKTGFDKTIWGEEVPFMRNLYGEKITREILDVPVLKYFNPIWIRTENKNDIGMNEFKKVRYFPGKLKRNIFGYSLTGKEYEQYGIWAGEGVKRDVHDMIKNDFIYQEGNRETKVQMLQKVIADARRRARFQMADEFANVRKAKAIYDVDDISESARRQLLKEGNRMNTLIRNYR